MSVLPSCSLRLEKVPKRRAILYCGLTPIPLNRIPALAEAFLVGVTILGYNRGDSLGMCQSHAKTHWRAIIKHVERVTQQADFRGKCPDHAGKIIKRVFELRAGRCIRKSEARQIRRDHMIAVG